MRFWASHAKEILQMLGARVQFLAEWLGANAGMSMLNQDAPAVDVAINDTHRSTGCLWVMVIGWV